MSNFFYDEQCMGRTVLLDMKVSAPIEYEDFIENKELQETILSKYKIESIDTLLTILESKMTGLTKTMRIDSELFAKFMVLLKFDIIDIIPCPKNIYTYLRSEIYSNNDNSGLTELLEFKYIEKIKAHATNNIFIPNKYIKIFKFSNLAILKDFQKKELSVNSKIEKIVKSHYIENSRCLYLIYLILFNGDNNNIYLYANSLHTSWNIVSEDFVDQLYLNQNTAIPGGFVINISRIFFEVIQNIEKNEFAYEREKFEDIQFEKRTKNALEVLPKTISKHAKKMNTNFSIKLRYDDIDYSESVNSIISKNKEIEFNLEFGYVIFLGKKVELSNPRNSIAKESDKVTRAVKFIYCLIIEEKSGNIYFKDNETFQSICNKYDSFILPKKKTNNKTSLKRYVSTINQIFNKYGINYQLEKEEKGRIFKRR